MKLSAIKRSIFILALAGTALACALSGATPTAQPAQAPTEPPPAPTQVPPTATTAAEPTQAQPTALPQGAFSLPSEAECQQILGRAAGALNVAFSLDKGAFNSLDGQTGAGCIITTTGTGADFKSIPDVMQALLSAFGDAIPDPKQSADSPTGSIQGAWRGNTLLLVHSEWQPAPGTNCPQDQPVASCNLTPEQKLYTVTISAAKSQNPPILAGPAPTAGTDALPTPASKFVVDQVIRSDAGSLNITLNGSVSSGSYDRYRLTLAIRDGLDIRLSSPQQTAGFMLLDPAQEPMQGTENHKALWYSAQAGAAGEYAVIVSSISGRADYSIVVKVVPSGSPLPTAAPAAGGYKPLPADECKQIRARARDALQVTFTMSEGIFAAGTGESGLACVLVANGNGLNFTDVDTTRNALATAFSDWNYDPAFDADSPTGSAMGFRRANDLLLISVQWMPGPAAQCPANQPITSCNLPPEQMLYTVVLQGARR